MAWDVCIRGNEPPQPKNNNVIQCALWCTVCDDGVSFMYDMSPSIPIDGDIVVAIPYNNPNAIVDSIAIPACDRRTCAIVVLSNLDGMTDTTEDGDIERLEDAVVVVVVDGALDFFMPTTSSVISVFSF